MYAGQVIEQAATTELLTNPVHSTPTVFSALFFPLRKAL